MYLTESTDGMARKSEVSGPVPSIRVDFSAKGISLQPHSMSAAQVGTAGMQQYIHDYPEEENQISASSLFVGHDDVTELELRSPVEESNVDKIMTTKGRKVGSAVPFAKKVGMEKAGSFTGKVGLPPNNSRVFGGQPQSHHSTDASFTKKNESVSQPIDKICSKGERSSAIKIHRENYRQIPSVRETLLEEAWERKRDHILHCELNSTKKKPEPEKVGWSERIPRMRSLTDDDFDELRGCIDLGFSFSHDYIPDLCETLPALEVCYAITQNLHDSQSFLSPVSTLHDIPGLESPGSSSSESPISAWQICSPGENPQQVKTRLRHWARAVACTARQCC
eukprot:c27435_g2_i1 orf=854-1864(-)